MYTHKRGKSTPFVIFVGVFSNIEIEAYAFAVGKSNTAVLAAHKNAFSDKLVAEIPRLVAAESDTRLIEQRINVELFIRVLSLECREPVDKSALEREIPVSYARDRDAGPVAELP